MTDAPSAATATKRSSSTKIIIGGILLIIIAAAALVPYFFIVRSSGGCIVPMNASSSPLSSVTYRPGHLASRADCNGLRLSEGLASKIIARSYEPVSLKGGGTSTLRFHGYPDGGAVFPHADGGWAYTSNSEMRDGGVYSLRFDSSGEVIDYFDIAKGTNYNCGGGRTPWGTWLTCEETHGGYVHETDPFGEFASRVTSIGYLGARGGSYESVAYDNRTSLRFFLTEDSERGALQRFSPSNWRAGASSILEGGDTDFLVLTDVATTPDANGILTAKFQWTRDEEAARNSAAQHHPHVEGIDFRPTDCAGRTRRRLRGDGAGCGRLYFVSKVAKRLVTLFFDADDADRGVAHLSSTVSGAFNHQPDQIAAIVGPDGHSLLYFCEDGGGTVGGDVGVHARDAAGRFYTILDAYPAYQSETTGLSFSPDMKHMYVALQGSSQASGDPGVIFDIYRLDGHPFGGRSLDIKYHAAE